jgi:hypothetical protein
MKHKYNSEFDKERKIHKVVKNKDQKYRKIPYEYLDEQDPDEDDFDDDYTVDIDTET